MKEIESFNDQALKPGERAIVAALPPLERQQLVGSILVRYPRYKAAAEFVSKFHRPVLGGTHGRGQLGVLLGASRAGKSFMLQDYSTSFPAETVEGAITRPVVYIEIKNEMTPHDIATYFHFALGYRSIPNVKTIRLMDMAIEDLPAHRVELVILDDIDNSLAHTRSSYVKSSLGLIKGILDSGSCNVLCAGRMRLYQILKGVEQLEGRGGLPNTVIEPYRWRFEAEREQIRLLLGGIDNRLPFREKSNLGSPELAAQFYQLSGGLIGRIMDVVRDAAHEAINDGADRIENEHLVYAAKLRMSPGATFVPFQDDLDHERIDLERVMHLS